MIVYDHGEVKEWSMFHAHDLNTLRACIFAARKIYQLCHRIVYLRILFLSLDLTTCTRKRGIHINNSNETNFKKDN